MEDSSTSQKNEENSKTYKSFWRVFAIVLVVSFGALFFGYSIGVMTLASDTIWKVFGIETSR